MKAFCGSTNVKAPVYATAPEWTDTELVRIRKLFSTKFPKEHPKIQSSVRIHYPVANSAFRYEDIALQLHILYVVVPLYKLELPQVTRNITSEISEFSEEFTFKPLWRSFTKWYDDNPR